MTPILDIHTHRSAPYPEGIVSLRIDGHSEPLASIIPGQYYSIGIHPWDIREADIDKSLEQLEISAAHPQVVAIGECGIDLAPQLNSDGDSTPKGGPLFRQMQIFRHHVELSESCQKPLIIHSVKADDIICGLRRDLHPTQHWAIHGFRGKPGGAISLLRAGCYLSFGEKFNAESAFTVINTFPERFLAETDESELSIEDIIARLYEAISLSDNVLNWKISYLQALIAENSKKFCNFESLDNI